ncbi:amidohydrolase family protein [Pseudonocardia xishanensis]|uniref:Amidohydrolase family protein n=1 Tax=Pseudonocardia xishanensis TaxID=630995 RepID=A0ABP8RU15_9PSEU
MGAAAPTTVIDSDVHERLSGTDVLLPYLAKPWHSYVTDYDFKSGYIKGGFPYALKGGDRLDWSTKYGPAAVSVEAMRHHLFEESDTSLAILNGFFHFSAMAASFEFATALASAYNDWQIAEWLDKEPRLRGSVHVVAADPASAVREIDRVAAHPGMVQVFMPTVGDRQYGDPYYHPIYEAAARHDLVVTFHHGAPTPTLLGYPRYFAEWHVLAAPQAAMSQLTSLVFNGVLDRFDGLKFLFLECSLGWLPWHMRRMDENLREFSTEVPWVRRLPSEAVRASVRLSTQPMGELKPSEYKRLVEELETDELFLFSSDYPHYDADDAAKTFPESLPDAMREAVLFRNALATFPRLSGVTA